MVKISAAPAWTAKLTSDTAGTRRRAEPNVLDTCDSSSSGAIMQCLRGRQSRQLDDPAPAQSWSGSRDGNGRRLADSADGRGSPRGATPGWGDCRADRPP